MGGRQKRDDCPEIWGTISRNESVWNRVREKMGFVRPQTRAAQKRIVWFRCGSRCHGPPDILESPLFLRVWRRLWLCGSRTKARPEKSSTQRAVAGSLLRRGGSGERRARGGDQGAEEPDLPAPSRASSTCCQRSPLLAPRRATRARSPRRLGLRGRAVQKGAERRRHTQCQARRSEGWSRRAGWTRSELCTHRSRTAPPRRSARISKAIMEGGGKGCQHVHFGTARR